MCCTVKTYTSYTYYPAISLIGIYPREMKANFHKKAFYTGANLNFIHSGPKLQAFQYSSSEQIEKPWYIHTIKYYLSNEERATDIRSNISEPQNHKMSTETLHQSTFMQDCSDEKF